MRILSFDGGVVRRYDWGVACCVLHVAWTIVLDLPDGSQPDFIFTTTGMQSIFGECETVNPASARVMEKAGMTLVAEYTWRDETSGRPISSLRFDIHKAEWLQRMSVVSSTLTVSSESMMY